MTLEQSIEEAKILCQKAIKEKGYSPKGIVDLASRLRWVWLDIQKRPFEKAVEWLKERERL